MPFEDSLCGCVCILESEIIYRSCDDYDSYPFESVVVSSLEHMKGKEKGKRKELIHSRQNQVRTDWIFFKWQVLHYDILLYDILPSRFLSHLQSPILLHLPNFAPLMNIKRSKHSVNSFVTLKILARFHNIVNTKRMGGERMKEGKEKKSRLIIIPDDVTVGKSF